MKIGFPTLRKRQGEVSGLLPAVFVAGSAMAMAMPMEAENWPQWRGPRGTGVSQEEGLPVTWGPQTHVRWKANLAGRGSSVPIVFGDRVFITSQTGSGPVERDRGPRGLARHGDRAVTFVVQSFHVDDGRRLWQFELPASRPLTSVHPMHNLSSPSPVTDGSRVIAWFGSGQIVALDLDGKLIWQRDLATDVAPFELLWGHGSSPYLYEDLVYLLCEHDPAAHLLALDKGTGETVWKVKRGAGRRSYSTPLVITYDVSAGARGATKEVVSELIVNSNPGIDAYDPGSGEHLWSADGFCKVPVPMPVFHDGLLYTSRGYASGPYMAIRPGGRGDVTKSHVLWRQPTGAPYVASLLYYQGIIYMASENGIVRAIDPENGETLWIDRLGGRFWASPVAADGKVYLVAESGETVVLAAGPRLEVVARNPLGERVVASPAISGGRLYIRSDEHLFSIGAAASRGNQ